jgi:hypothetical protein
MPTLATPPLALALLESKLVGFRETALKHA